MARLEAKESGRWYIRIPRGLGFSTHTLNTFGEARLIRIGFSIGDLIPFYVLQMLDQNAECQPKCGAFKGQQQFDRDDFLKRIGDAHTKGENPLKQFRPITVTSQQQLEFFANGWSEPLPWAA